MPAGNVYVAYSAFTGHGANEQSVILFSRSTNCGATWSAPKALSTGSRLVQNAQIAVSPTDGAVYVSWRRFKYQTQDDAVMVVKSTDGGANFSKVAARLGRPSVRPGHHGRPRSGPMASRRWRSTAPAASTWPGPIAATRRRGPTR